MSDSALLLLAVALIAVVVLGANPVAQRILPTQVGDGDRRRFAYKVLVRGIMALGLLLCGLTMAWLAGERLW